MLINPFVLQRDATGIPMTSDVDFAGNAEIVHLDYFLSLAHREYYGAENKDAKSLRRKTVITRCDNTVKIPCKDRRRDR